MTKNYSKVARSQYLERGDLSNVSASKELRTAAFEPLRNGLIVSCQVPDGTPIDTPGFIAAQAETVVQAGAVGIRARGVANIVAISKVTTVPIIGLVKRYLNTTPIYITPTVEDVLELENAGASIVAIDATTRQRPNGVTLADFLIQLRKSSRVPLLADVDTLEAALIAESLGCEAVATTLSGYTDIPAPPLPNIGLIESLSKRLKIPVIAEGGINQPNQVKMAFEAGAWSVCIGTAITNPYLLTKAFIEAIN